MRVCMKGVVWEPVWVRSEMQGGGMGEEEYTEAF